MQKPKPWPDLKTDEEAEAFLEQDLSEYDFSQFKPARFEFVKKSARYRPNEPIRTNVAPDGDD